MIRGLVFDVDGVLVDTEHYQWQGWVEVLKKRGFGMNEQEYLHYTGKSGIFIEEILYGKYKLGIKKGELLEEKEALLKKWFREKPITVMEGVREVLDYFSKSGIKMAAASSGPREETLLKLERTDLRKYFELVVSSDDVGKIGKPDPAVYKYTVAKMGLNASECVAFEDTENGVLSSKGAGLICIAIPSSLARAQDFSRADYVCKSLEEAEKIAKKIIGP